MKILHLDIETAPHKVYAWGLYDQTIAINQIVEPGYTLCFAAKWHDKKKIMFHGINKCSPREMIDAAWELLSETDVVVHYNGSKFDIPTLNREFKEHGLRPPDSFHEVDLLKTVRKKFRYPSNKLDYVSQQLGIGSKVQHKGMDLWRDCMDGCKKAWKVMEQYNKQDVNLLESLYIELLPWIDNHPNHALFRKKLPDRPTCTNCNSENVIAYGNRYTRSGIFQRFVCKDCGTQMRSRKRKVATPDGVLT